MSNITNILKNNNLNPFDEYVEENSNELSRVHLRIQQRAGKKFVTIVEGLPESFDLSKISKVLQKKLCCNATIVDDNKNGKTLKVIQLQGDHRHEIATFFINEELLSKDQIKIHGF